MGDRGCEGAWSSPQGSAGCIREGLRRGDRGARGAWALENSTKDGENVVSTQAIPLASRGAETMHRKDKVCCTETQKCFPQQNCVTKSD